MTTADCQCARCRLGRGEIPPGPFTPAEFREYGLEKLVVPSNPTSDAVRADPRVKAAAAAVEAALAVYDARAAEWERAVGAAAEAELQAMADRQTRYNPRTGEVQPPATVITSDVEAKSATAADARDARDEAWKRVVRAKDRQRAAIARALNAALAE
jgi:hypothetical protein